MKTNKPKSRAAKIRTLLRIDPNTKAETLADRFNMTKQAAHVQLAVQRKALGIVRTKEGKYVFNKPLSVFSLEKISTPAKAGSLVKTDDAPRIVAEHFPLTPDLVNHPPHYKVGGIETIDFIEAKQLNYNLGNVVKYIKRADHKGNRLEDLEKARWYLQREIGNLSEKLATSK